MSKTYTTALLLAAAAFTAPVQAFSDVELLSALSCNSQTTRSFYKAEFDKAYGQFKTHSDAHWFSGKSSIYGFKIREVFVSAIAPYNFVGVVLEATPKQVADAIQSSRLYPSNMHLNVSENKWVSSDARQLVWHEQKYAKLFCPGTNDGRY